jgi:hypothetical protein
MRQANISNKWYPPQSLFTVIFGFAVSTRIGICRRFLMDDPRAARKKSVIFEAPDGHARSSARNLAHAKRAAAFSRPNCCVMMAPATAGNGLEHDPEKAGPAPG